MARLAYINIGDDDCRVINHRPYVSIHERLLEASEKLLLACGRHHDEFIAGGGVCPGPGFAS
jgi:hypothetical protein